MRRVDLRRAPRLLWVAPREHWILDEHQRYVLRKSRGQLVEETVQQLEAARQAGCHANLFINEASRAPLDDLRQVVLAGKQAGAAVTLVDSFGVARPGAIALLIRQVREWASLPVDVHCHNDFGLSTANVLANYEAGATGLNVSVNGLGYRAGNAVLDEVVMALEVLYGIDTRIRLELLPQLSQLVAEITGVPVGYFKPISGKGAFSMEQWTTGAAMESASARPVSDREG